MAKLSPIAVAAIAGVGVLAVAAAGRKRGAGKPAPSTKAPTSSAPKKRRTDLPKVPMDLAAAKREAPAIAAEVTARQYDYDRPRMAIFQQHAGLDGDGLYGPRTQSAVQYFGVKDAPRALFKGVASTYLPPAGGLQSQPQSFGPPAPPLQQSGEWGGGGGASGGAGASGSWDEAPSGFDGAGASGSWDDGMESARRAAQIVHQGGGSRDTGAPAQERGDVAPPTPSNLDLARREAPALAKHIASKKQNYSRQSVKSFQAHAGLVPDGFYGPVTRSALQYFGVANPPPAIAKGKPGGATTYTPPT